EAQHEFGLSLVSWEELPRADALVVAVAHRSFVGMPLDKITAKLNPGGCFIDVKARFDRSALEAAGFSVWRLRPVVGAEPLRETREACVQRRGGREADRARQRGGIGVGGLHVARLHRAHLQLRLRA